MADGLGPLTCLAHCLSPEAAHRLGLLALRWRLLPRQCAVESPALSVSLFGLEFKNPVGLAAGFDKNASAVAALLNQGFGFVEAGTVTPLPQAGNPKPRVFRLPKDRAVINRLGFNNEGLLRFVQNLSSWRGPGIVGVNIGKNKDTEDIARDYTQGLQAVYPHASYITVNISSPNTPGLRALQKRKALGELLLALGRTREACAAQHGKDVPLLVKVAPDLDEVEKQDIAELVTSHNVSGLIVSNTTVSRPNHLKSRHKGEQGGLSGKPLFDLATQTLKDFYRLTSGSLPLVGVGGIASAEDAYAKIRAGASLVQLYTALVYQGFSLIPKIQQGLITLLEKDGFSHISQAVGKDA